MSWLVLLVVPWTWSLASLHSVMNTWSVTPFTWWWTRFTMLQCLEGSLSSRPRFQNRLELRSSSILQIFTPLLVPERSLQRPGKPLSVQARLRVMTHVQALSTRTCWTSSVSTMMMAIQLFMDLLLSQCWPRCDASCVTHIRSNPTRTHPDQYDRLCIQYKPIRSWFIGLY